MDTIPRVGDTVHYIEQPWMAFNINKRPTHHLAAQVAQVISEKNSELRLAVLDPERPTVIYRTACYSNENDYGTWHSREGCNQ